MLFFIIYDKFFLPTNYLKASKFARKSYSFRISFLYANIHFFLFIDKKIS